MSAGERLFLSQYTKRTVHKGKDYIKKENSFMQKPLQIKLRHKPWTGRIYFQHIKQQICWFPNYVDGESLQISIKKDS